MNKRMHRLLRLVLLFLFFGTMSSLHAQDLLKGQDLRQIKVDLLSDADIAKLRNQMNAAGITIEQAEQMALAKGMPATEIAKLKKRLGDSNQTTNNTVGKIKSPIADDGSRQVNTQDSLDRSRYPEQNKRRPLIDSMIFGSELYTALAPNFEPNLNLATPLNYVLGPTDQINVNIYGVQQYDGNLKVSPEGSIFIPSVGQIRVSGLTIEAATEKIKTVLGNTVYPYLKNGGSKLSVTLSGIRTIRVNVIGSVYPGSINLPSLATVFHALYIAGGPSNFGSFREIELIRDGKVYRKIDLYHFLLHGDQTDNIGLRDNDVIRIPVYKTRVELQGQVKRQGIFEVLPGESFSDILVFASGFTDTAYKANIKVYQRTERDRALKDLSMSAYNTYQPQSGDVFVISKTNNRFENRIKITGAVYRPDSYALTSGMRVAELIKKADGLREDAFMGRGLIMRLQDDLTRSVVPFDIKKALNNEPENNIPLQREDEVLITSIQDLHDTLKVIIQGEVRRQGQYDYVDGLTLKDLILQAGGFTDAAYKNIEISRLIKRDSIIATDYRSAEMITTQLNNDLQSATANIILQPYDVITIRRKVGYQLPQSIVVSGQVQFPGPYTLNSLVERVSDLYRRAGGALPDANLAGAYIKRFQKPFKRETAIQAAKKIHGTGVDTTNVLDELVLDYDQIPLELPAILANPGSIGDIVLKERDELVIPKYDAQVRISGAVLLPTQIPYTAGYNIEDYIASGGGYAGRAWKNKVYIIYPNGKVAITKHFLFFKSRPKVFPGSVIVVPQKIERRGLSTGELVGITGALGSLAAVVVALLR